MRRLKSFFLILIALWLPIQAAAAVTMPFCRHAAEPAVAEAAHCHEQMVESVAASAVDCDNCAMCHLATAGYLLTAAETLPLPVENVLVAMLKPVSASYIPEPPQLPPRR